MAMKENLEEKEFQVPKDTGVWPAIQVLKEHLEKWDLQALGVNVARMVPAVRTVRRV
jgi:hypothetical protein